MLTLPILKDIYSSKEWNSDNWPYTSVSEAWLSR